MWMGSYEEGVLFFFNDTATTEIYTLSLHDALPIYDPGRGRLLDSRGPAGRRRHQWRQHRHRPDGARGGLGGRRRSEEHTSELQSRQYLVCRLLLEKKKKRDKTVPYLQSPPSIESAK